MPNTKPKLNSTHQIDEDLWVELSFPCSGRYPLTRRVDAICESRDCVHGHLREWSSDGAGVVPFPICSRAGFKKVLEMMQQKCGFGTAAVEGILALNLDESLPEDLTEAEADIFNDAQKLKELSYSLVVSNDHRANQCQTLAIILTKSGRGSTLSLILIDDRVEESNNRFNYNFWPLATNFLLYTKYICPIAMPAL